MLTITLDDYTGIESKKLTALKAFIKKYPNIKFVFSNAGGAFFSEGMQPSEISDIKLDYFSLDKLTANTVREIIATVSTPLSYSEQTKLIGRVFKSIHHLQAPRTIFYVQNFVDLFINEGGVEPLNKYLLVSNLLSTQMRQSWALTFPDELYDEDKVEAFIGFLVYHLHRDQKVIFSKDYFYELASRYKADVGFKFDSDDYFKFIRKSKLLSRYGDEYAFSIPSFEHYFLSKHMEFDEDFCDLVITVENFLDYTDAIEFYVAAHPSSKRISDSIFSILDTVSQNYEDEFTEIRSLKSDLMNMSPGESESYEQQVLTRFSDSDDKEHDERISNNFEDRSKRRSDEDRPSLAERDQFISAFLLCSSVIGVARLLKLDKKKELLERITPHLEMAFLSTLLTAAILASGETIDLGNRKVQADLSNTGIKREDYAYELTKTFSKNMLSLFGFRSGSVELYEAAEELLLDDSKGDDIFKAALFAQNFDSDIQKSVGKLHEINRLVDNVFMKELIIELFLDQAKLTPLSLSERNKASGALSKIAAQHKSKGKKNDTAIAAGIRKRIDIGQLVSEIKGIGVREQN